MKAVGILFIVLSCSGLGFQFAWLYSRRIAQCVEIERALQQLSGEIRFRQIPLAEAMRLVGREKGKEFSRFLVDLANHLEGCEGGGFSGIWEEELNRYLQGSLLEEEAELLKSLGQQLGDLDLEAQLKALERFLEQWRGRIGELRRQEEKKGRLYRYLGVFAGFFLAILFL